MVELGWNDKSHEVPGTFPHKNVPIIGKVPDIKLAWTSYLQEKNEALSIKLESIKL